MQKACRWCHYAKICNTKSRCFYITSYSFSNKPLIYFLWFRVVCCAVVAVLVALVASSPTMGWSGRSLSLLDPYVPILSLYSFFRLKYPFVYWLVPDTSMSISIIFAVCVNLFPSHCIFWSCIVCKLWAYFICWNQLTEGDIWYFRKCFTVCQID